MGRSNKNGVDLCVKAVFCVGVGVVGRFAFFVFLFGGFVWWRLFGVCSGWIFVELRLLCRFAPRNDKGEGDCPAGVCSVLVFAGLRLVCRFAQRGW
jgi:hypothetical protein